MNQDPNDKPDDQAEWDNEVKPDWEVAYENAASPNGPNNEDIDEEVEVLDRRRPQPKQQ